MNDRTTISAGTPDTLSKHDLARFRELIITGGEVDGAVIAVNIANARALAVIRQDGEIRGVAALKRPQASYRKKISTLSEVPLAAERYPYELGYVFIEPALRNRGLSHRLLDDALKHRDQTAVFATVRAENAPMLAALGAAGFKPAGKPYPGRGNQTIRLLILEPSST